MKWRPIKTAPKNKRILVLFSWAGTRLGRKRRLYVAEAQWRPMTKEFVAEPMHYCPRATHWMPRPADPLRTGSDAMNDHQEVKP
jgi:hypothetical protein